MLVQFCVGATSDVTFIGQFKSIDLLLCLSGGLTVAFSFSSMRIFENRDFVRLVGYSDAAGK